MLDYNQIFNLQTSKQFISEVNNIAEDLDFNTKDEIWCTLVDLLQTINPIYVNKKITYHNFIHICYVSILSNKIATDLNITHIEKRNLFIAALFHDFGHTTGRLHDMYNIAIAISYMKLFVLMFNNKYPLYLDVELIENLILKSSEIYYNERTDSENQLVGILRDSDLTMTLSILSKQFAIGYNNEMNTDYYNHDIMLQFAKSATKHTNIITNFLNER